MSVRVIGLLSTLVYLSVIASAEARALLSHRAVYSLSAGALEETGSLARMDGRLVVEAMEECDGFILNQRIVTRTVSTGGEESLSDLRIAFWESRNGREMRFSVATFIDGRLVSEDVGTARMSDGGGAGRATFKSGDVERLDLPAGTIFPMAHNLSILRMARQGGQMLDRTVFDGSAEDGPYDTFTVIGKVRAQSKEAARGQGLLAGMASWPVRTAYFLPDQVKATPDFEIGYNLFDNGVAGDLELDYGDFVLAGQLYSLEALPTQGCTE